MGNGAPAFVTERSEKSAPGRKWRTVSVPTGTVRSQSADFRAGDQSQAEIVWLHTPAPGVVGGLVKRWFDVIAATAAIVFLLPLVVCVAAAIKLLDPGPVFYRHRRIGLNGAPFDCLKFRTMVVDADTVLQRHLAANGDAAREWEQTRKLKRDPRVTPLGAAMRKTSLDELPQLLNILKGEMSFVGPRPIVDAEVPKYGAFIAHYLAARPGLTGPWQISGRNDVDYATRVALDRHYVEQWSLRRDLAIIAGTVRVVVTARGCY
jgi:exopolysaccharide production protein ExoY